MLIQMRLPTEGLASHRLAVALFTGRACLTCSTQCTAAAVRESGEHCSGDWTQQQRSESRTLQQCTLHYTRECAPAQLDHVGRHLLSACSPSYRVELECGHEESDPRCVKPPAQCTRAHHTQRSKSGIAVHACVYVSLTMRRPTPLAHEAMRVMGRGPHQGVGSGLL